MNCVAVLEGIDGYRTRTARYPEIIKLHPDTVDDLVREMQGAWFVQCDDLDEIYGLLVWESDEVPYGDYVLLPLEDVLV